MYEISITILEHDKLFPQRRIVNQHRYSPSTKIQLKNDGIPNSGLHSSFGIKEKKEEI